jgi:hypothetical protein
VLGQLSAFRIGDRAHNRQFEGHLKVQAHCHRPEGLTRSRPLFHRK